MPSSPSEPAYFRRTFTVDDPGAIAALTVELVRDDGAAVYLNGTEVVRDNLPAGPLSPTTLADAYVWGADEVTPLSFAIDPDLLVAGVNTIAIEVHQAGGSSDLRFDLALFAQGA